MALVDEVAEAEFSGLFTFVMPLVEGSCTDAGGTRESLFEFCPADS